MLILVATLGIVVAVFYGVPKGFVVHEGLRFPIWTYKMRRYPSKGLRPRKYVYGDHPRQYFIHYTPNDETVEREHVVVYIHGGGWQFGDPELFQPNAELLEEMGYHAFFLSHRRIPQYNIIRIKEDVGTAMRQVREVMAAQGISHKKILLGGVSSGANLSALFYLDKNLFASAGFRREFVAGLFLLAPPLDLAGMMHSPTLWWLAGKRNSPTFQAANPAYFLKEKDNLPLLIVHPDRDGMVPLRSTQSFVKKAQQLGFENLRFVVLENMTHLDAASWCFKNHPAFGIVTEWMATVDR